MKKVLLLMIILMISTLFLGERYEVPDFVGKDVSEALKWQVYKDVNVEIVSLYDDSIQSNHIIKQSIPKDGKIRAGDELIVYYSKGKDPESIVTLPEFMTMNESEILAWVETHDLYYSFQYALSDDVLEGELVKFEVKKNEEREEYKMNDHYEFTFSKGQLEIPEVSFDASKWQGVNLGGWFVLEGWMTPELFMGVNGTDETIFLQEKKEADKLLLNHWDTFITEDDFKWLKSIGIDYVRLPIPWWLFGERAYVGNPQEVTYLSSVEYIDRAMEWASKNDLNVLLDLHTAPGGQNGFDNGGLTGIREWGKNEEETGYMRLTVEVLKKVTERYSGYESFWGIEVLNEPSWEVPMPILHDFYLNAYHAIRSVDREVYIGFHDGFRLHEIDSWEEFFANDLDRVFLDTHIYSVFSEELKELSIFEHQEKLDQYYDEVLSSYQNIPLVVGEWSFALPEKAKRGYSTDDTKTITKAYGAKQLSLYNQCAGWFFWSYQIIRESHLEWDFRRLVENGYTSESFGE